VKHDNINPFIGICVDAPNVCVAMAYAERGSIQNVLADQQFQIDWEFRMSLALDVAQVSSRFFANGLRSLIPI